jgi:hypothetical protein
MSAALQLPQILDPWIQEMQDCPNCGGPQIFVLAWEFESGRVGCCLGCGDERVIPFSRTGRHIAAFILDGSR